MQAEIEEEVQMPSFEFNYPDEEAEIEEEELNEAKEFL